MRVNFSVVVFLRTDKPGDATGHPVDRIELTDYVSVFMDETLYSGQYESFGSWRNELDFQTNKFITSIFQSQTIIGMSYDDISSEKHIIRVSDIRNVVITRYDETVKHAFEDTFNIKL